MPIDKAAQPIRGISKDGDALSANEFHPPMLPALNASSVHRFLRMYADGDAAAEGQGVLAVKDSAGDLHYIKGTSEGEIIVNLGAEKADYIQGSVNAVNDGPTVTVVNETTAQDEKFTSLVVSGVGLVNVVLKAGTLASEVTVIDIDLTAGAPREVIQLNPPLFVASGDSIIVEATNNEPGSSNNNDVTVKATLFKEA